MRRMPVLLLAAILAVLLVGQSLAAARQATPEANPAALPATPIGEQLGWVLGVLNGGAAALTPEEATARFAPGFLAAVPAEQVVGFLQQSAALGPFALAGFTRLPTPPRPRPTRW